LASTTFPNGVPQTQTTLKYLNHESNIKLVQLINADDVNADGIGPWKPYLVKTVADGIDRNGDDKITINDRRIDGSTGVLEMAHDKGLLVHTWTFRNDASGYGFSDPKEEMTYYFDLGVDGLFTDFPDTGVSARKLTNNAVGNELLPVHCKNHKNERAEHSN